MFLNINNDINVVKVLKVSDNNKPLLTLTFPNLPRTFPHFITYFCAQLPSRQLPNNEKQNLQNKTNMHSGGFE